MFYHKPKVRSSFPEFPILLFTNPTFHLPEWVAANQVEKISMIITNAHNREVLECWEFKVENESVTKANGTTNGNGDVEKSDAKNPISTKDLNRIQSEIRDVMRQISATVSYLPLLDCICSFDILVHTLNECQIPENFNETAEVQIQNAQVVELKSFSTGLHKMQTIVNYKMTWKRKWREVKRRAKTISLFLLSLNELYVLSKFCGPWLVIL